MAGSSIGNIFNITTWGESHGVSIGVVVDGCPAGLSINEGIIQAYLDRRRPGQSKYSTKRAESDKVYILSGVFEGKTTGTPISMAMNNESQRSKDYSEVGGYYRPSHADYAYDRKYGFYDYRGGGRSSGRETAARVAAGAIALELLKELGIGVYAYTRSIGPIQINYDNVSRDNIKLSPLAMPDIDASKACEEYLDKLMESGDSAGGVIECVIRGVPAGIGEPVFGKLDACLAKAVMSIGAVKGVEIGAGFESAMSVGSLNNDPFINDISMHDNAENANSTCKCDMNDMAMSSIKKTSNNAGGILGGISDGSEIIFRAAVKPTPSISKEQKTVNKKGENVTITIKGRHDPVIVPRAVVVVESMAAITLADLLLVNMTNRLDRIKEFYKE